MKRNITILGLVGAALVFVACDVSTVTPDAEAAEKGVAEPGDSIFGPIVTDPFLVDGNSTVRSASAETRNLRALDR